MSSNVTRLLFEGLFRINPKGEHEPALAKTVSISEDQRTYIFTLHPSKWANGEELTAHDFEYAWKTILDSSFPSSYAYMFYSIKNAQKAYIGKCSRDDVGIKALDSHTLQVVLENPTPYFLEILANPLYSPVCRSCCKNENWATTDFPNFVSNGPYILKKHDLNSKIILEKNPLYWNSCPTKMDRISFTIVEDPLTAYNMLCSGDLDWFGEPCGSIPLNMINGLNPSSLHKEEIGQCTWLECQVETPPLNSQFVRKAIACAIERNAICDQLLGCEETPAASLIAKSLSNLPAPTFKNGDVQEARRLFEKGLSELGYTQETCPPITITYATNQTLQAIVSLIQKQLENALGVTVLLNECDYNTFLKRSFVGDFQVRLCDWFSLYHDAMYTLNCFKHKESGMNGPLWEDALYIEFLDKAEAAADPKERQKYMQQAEDRIMTQLPVIPVIYKKYKYLKSDHLCGESLSPIGQMEFKWIEKTG